jgi:hypothetical protein
MGTRTKALRRSLAGVLVHAAPGERLPPIRTLAERFGASVGATQTALSGLVSDGLVELDSHPGRGATLVSSTVGRLYHEAEPGPLLIALPLPSTRLISGLATAIKSSLAVAEVEAYLVFIRGARPRIKALRRGRCQVGVVSQLAADVLSGHEFETILSLGPGSYVRDHRVFFVKEPHPNARLRVGIDHASVDFERLTELEFADQPVEYVSLNYLTAVSAMVANEIDVAILDVDDAHVGFPADIQCRPLSARVLEDLSGRNTRAAFVARRDSIAVEAVVRACLDAASMERAQQDVIALRRPAEF